MGFFDSKSSNKSQSWTVATTENTNIGDVEGISLSDVSDVDLSISQTDQGAVAESFELARAALDGGAESQASLFDFLEKTQEASVAQANQALDAVITGERSESEASLEKLAETALKLAAVVALAFVAIKIWGRR